MQYFADVNFAEQSVAYRLCTDKQHLQHITNVKCCLTAQSCFCHYFVYTLHYCKVL